MNNYYIYTINYVKDQFLFVFFHFKGKLVLDYWPKEDSLFTYFVTGKTLLVCSVQSDHPFTLKWFKDGKEVNLASTSVPLWGYNFKDKTGAAFWHWPYHSDFLSKATDYECRVSNGVDPPVSKKIRYTPLQCEYQTIDLPN